MKAGIFIIIGIVICLSNQSSAQGFNRSYDSYYSPQVTGSVVEISNNNYIMFGGGTDSLGNYGVELYRINEHGDVVWWKPYISATKRYYYGYRGSLILFPDSTLFAFGSVYYPDGEQNYVLFRFNLNGDTLYTKEWGNPGWEYGAFCRKSPDGNLLLGGITKTMGISKEDFYLAKCDLNGNILWEENYDAGSRELLYSMDVNSIGEVYLAGTTYRGSSSYTDPFYVKVDSSGQLLWYDIVKFPQYPLLPESRSTTLNLLNNNEYLLLIAAEDDFGGSWPVTQKRDSSGMILWETLPNLNDIPNGFRHTHVGIGDTLIYIGLRVSYLPPQGFRHLHIVRGDTAGNIFDRRIYYKTDSFGLGANSEIFSSQRTSDGGLILGGHTQYYSYDHWALRLDASGCVVPNECGETPLVEVQTLLPENKPGSIYPNPVQDVLNWKAPGQMTSGFSPVSRLAPFSFHDADARPVLNIRDEALARKSTIPVAENSPQNYSYTIYDIQGRNLLQGRWELQDSGVYTVVVSSFPAGCYLLMVRSDKGFFKAEKWVKE
jgi:hypothetical protein